MQLKRFLKTGDCGFAQYTRFVVVDLTMIAIVVRDTIHIQHKMHAITLYRSGCTSLALFSASPPPRFPCVSQWLSTAIIVLNNYPPPKGCSGLRLPSGRRRSRRAKISVSIPRNHTTCKKRDQDIKKKIDQSQTSLWYSQDLNRLRRQREISKIV